MFHQNNVIGCRCRNAGFFEIHRDTLWEGRFHHSTLVVCTLLPWGPLELEERMLVELRAKTVRINVLGDILLPCSC